MEDLLLTRRALISLFSEAGLNCDIEYTKTPQDDQPGFYLKFNHSNAADTVKTGFERAGIPVYCELYDIADKNFPTLIGAACCRAYSPKDVFFKLSISNNQVGQAYNTALSARYKNFIPPAFYPAKQSFLELSNDISQNLSLHNLTHEYIQRYHLKLVRALRLSHEKSALKGLSHL